MKKLSSNVNVRCHLNLIIFVSTICQPQRDGQDELTRVVDQIPRWCFTNDHQVAKRKIARLIKAYAPPLYHNTIHRVNIN